MMRPMVGVLCDLEFRDGMASHRAGEEYVRAVRRGCGALPLLIPRMTALSLTPRGHIGPG